MNKIKAFIERSNDGTFSVYVDLEDNTLNYGIHGTGDTAEEAIKDFALSYEGMKKLHTQKGKEFVEAEFEYVYDTVSFLATEEEIENAAKDYAEFTESPSLDTLQDFKNGALWGQSRLREKLEEINRNK